MSIGRSSDYSEEMAGIICGRIAEGESLRAICSDADMPHASTVCRWLAVHSAFREQYAHAREIQADVLFDEVLHIADTPLMGEKTKTTSDGKVEVTTGDMLEHRKLQIDARKWMAARLQPKKYGEKVTNEITGADGGPIETRDVTDVDRAKAMAMLATRARHAKG